MKYSDILFEKTCVSLYIQEHCTVCTMLQEDQRTERRDVNSARKVEIEGEKVQQVN